MAQSDPTPDSGARGPRCRMRSSPPSSGDPAALKAETPAVRSVGSIALGLLVPILAAMARDAGPCSGRDCLALGPTARRSHAPPTDVSAHQARWSAEDRCRDSRPDQPYGARQCALGRTTHPRRIADAWFQGPPGDSVALSQKMCSAKVSGVAELSSNPAFLQAIDEGEAITEWSEAGPGSAAANDVRPAKRMEDRWVMEQSARASAGRRPPSFGRIDVPIHSLIERRPLHVRTNVMIVLSLCRIGCPQPRAPPHADPQARMTF